MSTDKIVISGTGCALADYLYNGVSFDSGIFKKFMSRKTGDGGLSPGKLVFTEELEKFAGRPYREIIKEIIGNRSPDAFNVGGPSLVSLIHAAQLLAEPDFEVRFFGVAGKDETADKILRIIQKTPLDIKNYISIDRHYSPFTDVFSDPDYDHGHGERTFVNNIGAAWDYSPDLIPDDFFDSHIVCFGGTGLVPVIHDHLSLLLGKAREKGCITVVNTVFDFRNQKKNPMLPWPLVGCSDDYALIDVLIMDCDEALGISGRKTMDEAFGFFASTKVSSFMITNGAKELVAWSGGGFFENTGKIELPVSRLVTDRLRLNPGLKGDTTGCGDNFAGGIIASLAWQMKEKGNRNFDFREALAWGVASGGHCCFTVGGTYLEKAPGDKRKEVEAIRKDYLHQIG